jgi:hypothetical protein
MLLARAKRALEHLRACVDRPGDVQEAFSNPPLQLAPKLIRPPQQGHIRGIFVVGEADDPRHAVGRSELVRNRETLQAEHAPTAASELEQGRAPHPADADDDRIEALATHPSSVPPPAGNQLRTA